MSNFWELFPSRIKGMKRMLEKRIWILINNSRTRNPTKSETCLPIVENSISFLNKHKKSIKIHLTTKKKDTPPIKNQSKLITDKIKINHMNLTFTHFCMRAFHWARPSMVTKNTHGAAKGLS